MNPHINSLQQLDRHWISSGLHLCGKVAVRINVKAVAEGAKVGLGEDVVRVVHVEGAGNAQDFGKPAREVDVNRPAPDYNLIGQLKGRDAVGENEVVAVFLCDAEQRTKRPSCHRRRYCHDHKQMVTQTSTLVPQVVKDMTPMMWVRLEVREHVGSLSFR